MIEKCPACKRQRYFTTTVGISSEIFVNVYKCSVCGYRKVKPRNIAPSKVAVLGSFSPNYVLVRTYQ